MVREKGKPHSKSSRKAGSHKRTGKEAWKGREITQGFLFDGRTRARERCTSSTLAAVMAHVVSRLGAHPMRRVSDVSPRAIFHLSVPAASPYPQALFLPDTLETHSLIPLCIPQIRLEATKAFHKQPCMGVGQAPWMCPAGTVPFPVSGMLSHKHI